MKSKNGVTVSNLLQGVGAALFLGLAIWGFVWTISPAPQKDGPAGFVYLLHQQMNWLMHWNGWRAIPVALLVFFVPLFTVIAVPYLLKELYPGFKPWFLRAFSSFLFFLGLTGVVYLVSLLVPDYTDTASLLYFCFGACFLAYAFVSSWLLSD